MAYVVFEKAEEIEEVVDGQEESGEELAERSSDPFIKKLAANPKVKNPEALGAWIGRKVNSSAEMKKWAKVGKNQTHKRH